MGVKLFKIDSLEKFDNYSESIRTNINDRNIDINGELPINITKLPIYEDVATLRTYFEDTVLPSINRHFFVVIDEAVVSTVYGIIDFTKEPDDINTQLNKFIISSNQTIIKETYDRLRCVLYSLGSEHIIVDAYNADVRFFKDLGFDYTKHTLTVELF